MILKSLSKIVFIFDLQLGQLIDHAINLRFVFGLFLNLVTVSYLSIEQLNHSYDNGQRQTKRNIQT